MSDSDRIHQSRLYAAKPLPCDCPRCGELSTDPNPPFQIESLYVDCPECGTFAFGELERTAEEQLRVDVRDLLRDDARKGVRGVGGGNNGGRRSPKKAGPRSGYRAEQEPIWGTNGNAGGIIKNGRFKMETTRVQLILSQDLHDAAMAECRMRGGVEQPFPFAVLVREAITDYLPLLTEAPTKFTPETPRRNQQMLLRSDERAMLTAACAAYGRAMGEIVDHCVRLHIGMDKATG